MHFRSRVGNVFASVGRKNCGISWRDSKILQLLMMKYTRKYTLCLFTFRAVRKENYDERERLFLTYCLSICLFCNFVLTWCCVLIWVKEILTRATLNGNREISRSRVSAFMTKFRSWRLNHQVSVMVSAITVSTTSGLLKRFCSATHFLEVFSRRPLEE